MNKPELLAPVGGKPHLIAAVNNGADAVYMGGMAFNARIFADNFSDEELPDAVNYAHAHGVKVYMTINTLVNDSELARAFEYCNYIYGTGVDGVIIQDFGSCLFICPLRAHCTIRRLRIPSRSSVSAEWCLREN